MGRFPFINIYPVGDLLKQIASKIEKHSFSCYEIYVVMS